MCAKRNKTKNRWPANTGAANNEGQPPDNPTTKGESSGAPSAPLQQQRRSQCLLNDDNQLPRQQTPDAPTSGLTSEDDGPKSPVSTSRSPKQASPTRAAEKQPVRERSTSPPPQLRLIYASISPEPLIRTDDVFFERLSNCIATQLSTIIDKPHDIDEKIVSELNRMSTSREADKEARNCLQVDTERRENAFLKSIEVLGNNITRNLASKMDAAMERFNLLNDASVETILHQVRAYTGHTTINGPTKSNATTLSMGDEAYGGIALATPPEAVPNLDMDESPAKKEPASGPHTPREPAHRGNPRTPSRENGPNSPFTPFSVPLQ